MEQVSGRINPGGSTVGLRFPLGEPTKEVRDYGNIKLIRGLIWTYFFLLIFEGFLRMVLPAFANALLVVRDPFLLVMYVVALVSKVFPWNKFVVMYWLLGISAVICGIFIIQNPLLVTLFGFRALFLHLPLIFLMLNVMDERDVISFGKWILVLSIPIAILMAIQFNVGPNHWLNQGLEKQFGQISSAAGKIRPPGTFTYVLGPSIFYSFVTSFLMYGQFNRGVFSPFLLWVSASASCLALAVSGSRSALAQSAVVIIIAVVIIALTRPSQFKGVARFMLIIALGLVVVSQLSIFNEGADVFSERIENAGKGEGGLIGFLERALGEYIAGYKMLFVAEPLGAGVGMGTNVAAVSITGSKSFLLAEGEWARVVLELGPFAGIVVLVMRTGLVARMFWVSFLKARLGQMLPILMFACCAMNILAGQWGQSTALGFAVFGGGLMFASTRIQADLRPRMTA